jgi:hypothetical protein
MPRGKARPFTTALFAIKKISSVALNQAIPEIVALDSRTCFQGVDAGKHSFTLHK